MFYCNCQQHGRAELLAVSKYDYASSIMVHSCCRPTAYDVCYDTYSWVAEDQKSANSILNHLHPYVRLKFGDLKILRRCIYVSIFRSLLFCSNSSAWHSCTDILFFLFFHSSV